MRWQIPLALNTLNRISLDHPQVRNMRDEFCRPLLTPPGIDLRESLN